MANVLKDMVEHRTQAKVNIDSNFMQWLIRWAAMLLSRYKVGPDGKTGYERRRGRKCRIPLAAVLGEGMVPQTGKDRGRNKFDIK